MGPDQLYVAPLVNVDVKFRFCAAQSGLLAPAVGAAGVAFTVTEIVPTGPEQPLIEV